MHNAVIEDIKLAWISGNFSDLFGIICYIIFPNNPTKKIKRKNQSKDSFKKNINNLCEAFMVLIFWPAIAWEERIKNDRHHWPLPQPIDKFSKEAYKEDFKKSIRLPVVFILFSFLALWIIYKIITGGSISNIIDDLFLQINKGG